MSIIPASRLSASDLSLIGNNTLPAVVIDRMDLRAVNRSLTVHGESVRRLDRRGTGNRKFKRAA